MKAKYNQMLDDQKRQVQLIEETILMTKHGYADSLKELEKISEEIHEKRERDRAVIKRLGDRGQGVGAECPGPERNSSSSCCSSSNFLTPASSSHGIGRKESGGHEEESSPILSSANEPAATKSANSQSAKDLIDEVRRKRHKKKVFSVLVIGKCV